MSIVNRQLSSLVVFTGIYLKLLKRVEYQKEDVPILQDTRGVGIMFGGANLCVYLSRLVALSLSCTAHMVL